MPSISFIVSAFNRPDHLRCCLASLALQGGSHEIIVADNSMDSCIRYLHEGIAARFDARWMPTEQPSSYHSAELVAPLTIGEWLCFPSDDSYYVPHFSDRMLSFAARHGWDLVYSDTAYDWSGHFPLNHPKLIDGVLRVEPRVNWIDKTSFMIKRQWMVNDETKETIAPFPGKNGSLPTASDGLFIESLRRKGIRHGKAPGVMVVHN